MQLNDTHHDDELIEQIVAVINEQNLLHGVQYKASHLLPDCVWKELSTSDKTTIGRIVRRLADTEQIPLVYIERNSSNHCIYNKR